MTAIVIPTDPQPNTYNMVFKANADFTRILTYTGPSPTFTPIDITNYQAQMMLAPVPLPVIMNPSPTFLLTTENGGIVLSDPTGGELTINIPSIHTMQFRWFNGQYDLFLKTPGGAVIPFLTGTITIVASILSPQWVN